MNIDISKLPKNPSSLSGPGGFVLSYDSNNKQLKLAKCQCICHKNSGVTHIAPCCSYVDHYNKIHFENYQIPSNYPGKTY